MLLIAVTAAMVVKAQTEQKITVEQLFQLVESNSKTLQSQKISVEFAKKGIEVARTARLPELSASASVSLNGDVLVTDRDFSNAQSFTAPRWGNSFALQARQIVYAGGAINAGISLAELQHEQAQASEQLSREQQRFIALGQFLEIFKLRNHESVITKNIELTRNLISEIEAKFEQGVALKNDVTRYELQLENLKLQLTKSRNQRAILNHQLCNLLGIDATIVPHLPADHNTFLNSVRDESSDQSLFGWQSSALASSPAIHMAQIRQKIAQQEIKLAKSELRPEIAITAGDNFSGPFTYDIPPLNKNINYWYLGVGIKYPISSLFKSNKKVQRAMVNQRRADTDRLIAAENLNNQVQQAWTLHNQAFVELETQKKSVELAKQNYQVVNDRYLSQLALITDMLDASNTLLNAEILEVDASINILFTYYRMKYIAGTL